MIFNAVLFFLSITALVAVFLTLAAYAPTSRKRENKKTDLPWEYFIVAASVCVASITYFNSSILRDDLDLSAISAFIIFISGMNVTGSVFNIHDFYASKHENPHAEHSEKVEA